MRLSILSSVLIVVFITSTVANAQSTQCTGTPKTFNGLPCASTTRYWDGNTGACGCGTGNTSPFSWQYTQYTAAASAPIFGTATWCGTGCGKCFKIAPTAAGSSPEGRGAPNTDSIVIKVTNLCPSGGNEAWCAASGVNSFGYGAHFDLMDYNMAGVITSLGWDNPEVTYQEVDCDTNNYPNWGCQCASYDDVNATTNGATSAPTAAPTSAPTSAPTTAAPATAAPTTPKATSAPHHSTSTTRAPTTKAPTHAPTQAPTQAATSAPTTQSATSSATSTDNIQVQIVSGSNQWWLGVTVITNPSSIAKVEINDSGSASSAWTSLTYEGNQYWNMYYVNPSEPLQLPISLRFTTASGETVSATNAITSFSSSVIDTGASF